MAFNWNTYYNKILSMEAQGASQSEIAAEISDLSGEEVSRDMVRHALERAHEAVIPFNEMPKPDRIPYVTKYLPYITGDKPPLPKLTHRRAEFLRKKKAKLLSLADLHVPFHDEAKFSEAVEMHRDADAVCIIADLIDAYDLSSFVKGLDMPFVFELDEALRILEYLSENFDWIEVLEANHEERVKRTIESNLPPSLQFMARKNIIEILAAPFPNIYVHNDLWFFQLGTGIYAHPSKASKVELRTAVEVYEHMKEWETFYGLKPWNLVQVAHTHGMGISYASRAKLMETGALCISQGYALSPKIPYKHPMSQGYSTVEYNEGVVNWNGTREYRFPIDPMKKN